MGGNVLQEVWPLFPVNSITGNRGLRLGVITATFYFGFPIALISAPFWQTLAGTFIVGAAAIGISLFSYKLSVGQTMDDMIAKVCSIVAILGLAAAGAFFAIHVSAGLPIVLAAAALGAVTGCVASPLITKLINSPKAAFAFFILGIVAVAALTIFNGGIPIFAALGYQAVFTFITTYPAIMGVMSTLALGLLGAVTKLITKCFSNSALKHSNDLNAPLLGELTEPSQATSSSES